MNILITGISGFVGSSLTEYFQTKSNVALFGHSRSREAAMQKFAGQRIEIIPDYKPERLNSLHVHSIIHLAGIAHDLSNRFSPQDYYKVNFEDTKTAFSNFLKSNARQFIFVSSIKACIDSSSSPADESIIPKPVSDYGKSKQMAEHYLLNQVLPGNKRVYIFRPCMIHGKGNKGNLNALYKYIRSGLPYIFGAYHNSRSFLSAANLNFIIDEFSQNDFPSGIYHLADDKPLSTNDLIKIISQSFNRSAKIWEVSQGLVNTFSKFVSVFGLPLERFKQKLTEDLVVSNVKLLQTIGKPLPMSSEEGLTVTIKSFHD